MSSRKVLFLIVALLPALAFAKSLAPAPKAALVSSAQQAGELVPATAMTALFFEDAQSAQGLVQLLTSASQASPSLAPNLVAQDLTRALGVDPLGSGGLVGLAPIGPRALVVEPRAIGYTAPIAQGGEAKAKAALATWLGQLGTPRPTRSGPLKGPLASGSGDQVRAGMIAPQAGSLRWISASGRGAAALVSQLAHVGHKAQDNAPLGSSKTLAAALAAVPGPLRGWSRGEAPILGTLVSINASAAGLNARGLIVPAPDAPPLLEGTAPPEAACGGAPLLCARAAPGPALRALAPLFVRELVARDLLGPQREQLDAMLQHALAQTKGPVLARIETLRARSLTEPDQLLAALPSSIASGATTPGALVLPAKLPAAWSALPAPQSGVMLSARPQLCAQEGSGAVWIASPCGPLPAHLAEAGGAKEIAARIDTQALARSLQPLSALDALRGSLSAGAFAMKLLWGELLARSGPIDVSARPASQPDPALANALDLTFAWPLSMAGTPK
jgi:hypothetical protein